MPTFSSAGLSAASTAVLPVASIIAATRPATLFFKNMDCLQRNYKLQNNSIAQTAARCQVIKTFVDFIKREGLAQKLVDRQAAILLQVDIACDIEIGRAHVCTPVNHAHLVCCFLLDINK